MQIDWLTVAAQIANFLVLVWLLKRFLYAPVMGAMERRQQRIAARLREAEEKKHEAEREARRYREQQDALERRREEMLEAAKQAAEEQRRSLEHEARAEVEARKRDWLRQVESQRDEFFRELSRHAGEQFFRLARRALGDLADAELEEHIARRFVRELEGLEPEPRQRIAQACARAGGSVRIRSRFALPAEARRRLTRAVHEHLAEDAEVAYEQTDDLLCGIELRAGSQAVDWSLRGYLDGLEATVGERVSGVLAPADEQAAS